MKLKLKQAWLMLILGVLIQVKSVGQEPGFMQFNAAPLSINPALAGSYGSDWRVAMQARSQWLGKGTTYSTQAVTGDCRIKTLDEGNYLGVGGMVVSDKAMEGLYKSNYFTLNGAYHFALNDGFSGLAAGIGIVGNNSRVDYSQLLFDQQLTSSGFDRTLFSGEPGMRNNTSFLSASAGLMYTFTSDLMYFEAGVSGFRFVKMNRSLLGDKNQFIQPRYTAHGFFSGALSDRTSVMASGMHMVMNKSNVSYLGLGLSILLSGQHFLDSKVFSFGTYYNTRGVVAPFLGYQFSNYEVGVSYDVNISPLKTSSIANKAVELSISYNMFSSDGRSKVRCFNPY